ncbi:MAG: DUF4974 domain-containing protein [Rhodothermaceae bacterium]|nr:DUF4974 domain-containing protein [Rhodothermaceae bacterium]MYE62795.1 DUF4974 domain-containing protein [Rhodothermaceae bacterium]MYJ20103.1 DUF4974 domain-containing protein [Rhodothermaceae bacterium]
MNTDPNSSLPDEILGHLDFSEIPDTLTVWQLASAYYDREPSAQEFEGVGSDMWPLIQKATRPAYMRVVTWPRAVALAACIALVIAVGITLTQPTSVFAPHGEQLTHQLPDGSTVLLNSGTRIEYSRNFGESSRELTLQEGEVLLDVEHSSTPFTVETFDAQTKVLGTSFNVRSWPDELNAATDVTVESGRVQVAPRTSTDLAVVLTAGQSARIQPVGQRPLVTQGTEASMEKLAWVDGGFKFSDQPLGKVAREMERRYDVEITLEAPDLESFKSKPIGILKESPETVEEIILDICALHCEYRAVSNGFLLTPPR